MLALVVGPTVFAAPNDFVVRKLNLGAGTTVVLSADLPDSTAICFPMRTGNDVCVPLEALRHQAGAAIRAAHRK